MYFDRSEVKAALPTLGQQPSVELFNRPTDIESVSALSNHLDLDITFKRDDLLPLSFGGNKIRQLEYYFGQAKLNNSDTVLITGAVQSNFVRLCAAAAVKQGWKAVVQLEDRVPKDDVAYNKSGNYLLDNLLGAEIVRFSEGENEAAADANLDNLAEDLKSKGRKPYVIHLSISHPPYGAFGYVEAAVETYLQCKKNGSFPDYVVVPSGSALTHVGFLVGARAVGWDVPIHGICVRRDKSSQYDRVKRRVSELLDLAGLDRSLVTEDDIILDDATLAPGYGRINDAVKSAIELTAQKEAIFLDPVYSGRTFAGLINLKNNRNFEGGKKVLFIHTGGQPAIFAYQNDLLTNNLVG